MRILVTGATGFIGRYLTETLDEKGYHCRCLVRDINNTSEIHKRLKHTEFVVGDITQPRSLAGITDNIDVVFHLAALLGDSSNRDNDIWNVNVNGTRHLVEESSGVQQFIFSSTPGVQGFGYKQATEDLPYGPAGMYEKSKVTAECVVMQLCTERRIKWSVLRPDFVYGPGDLRRVPLYKRIKSGRMYLIGTGQASMSPTYVTDAVNAFISCIENKHAYNSIFNVSGEQVTVEYFLKTIASSFGVPLPTGRVPSFLAYSGAALFELVYNRILGAESPITTSKVRFLTQDHSTDNSKARMLLDFRSTLTLEQGVKRTIEWCRRERLFS